MDAKIFGDPAENKLPENKIDAVRFLSALEKTQKIKCTEGINWRMLSHGDLIKLAQSIWREKNN
jgi:hypothetical protein